MKLTEKVSIFNVTLLSIIATMKNNVLHSILTNVFPPFTLHKPSKVVFTLVATTTIYVNFQRFRVPHQKQGLILFTCHISSATNLTTFAIANTVTTVSDCPNCQCILPILLKLVATIKNNVLHSILTRGIPIMLCRSICTVTSILKNVIVYILCPLAKVMCTS